jgi:hypothetical protein
MRSFFVGLCCFAATLACYSSSPASRPVPRSTDPYLIILAAELRATERGNLYDAVRQLRPNWFTRTTRNRGSNEENILVYFDDRQIGNVTHLRRFTIEAATTVRYLSPTDAQVRFGQINNMRPAILIESARP